VSGKPLWHFQTGAGIQANPVAYAIGERQYVAVAAGGTLQVFSLASPSP
jgi:alcohol dehydrogenase (cytochrome c)